MPNQKQQNNTRINTFYPGREKPKSVWHTALTSKKAHFVITVVLAGVCLILLYAIYSGSEISSGKDAWIRIKPRNTEHIRLLEAEIEKLKQNTISAEQYQDILSQLEDLRRTTISIGMLPQDFQLQTPEDVVKAIKNLLQQVRESMGEVNFSISVVGNEVASRNILDTSRMKSNSEKNINYHIQKVLSALNYYEGELNGNKDDTYKAVTKFQSSNGLKVDGKIGKNTWAKVKELWQNAQSEK